MYLLFCTDFYIFRNFVFFVFLVVQYRRSVISKIKRLDTNTRDFGYNKGKVRGIIGILSLGRTRKFILLLWYKGGRGVDGTPPRSFWYVAVFWNDFSFSGKPLIFLTRWGIVYGRWWCWGSLTSPITAAIFGFYQELEIWLKTREMVFFCALHEKTQINKHFVWFKLQEDRNIRYISLF